MAVVETILVVFDFDHTLIDVNSDTWILALKPDLKRLLQRRSGVCWTDLMNDVFAGLFDEGVGPEAIRQCVEKVPFHDDMKKTCSLLARAQNINLLLISDANRVFIDTILSAHGLDAAFDKIYTNPAEFDESGRLRVSYHHTHACKRCPKNLCKGTVLKDYLKDVSYAKKIYVGDGKGDVCPCLLLDSPTDYVLAKTGFPLLEILRDPDVGFKGNLVPWNTGTDVLEFVYKEILRTGAPGVRF
ncbi:pyridoxal phosphate phosphatase PHOSPHO2-like [Oscarella lobularis]|uniref:pyridoxal phosphate phosphatase PHOSPHO2-like n=1 Tax=Oscarella lobularis TaxID=121494 RepID=UPI0033134E87